VLKLVKRYSPIVIPILLLLLFSKEEQKKTSNPSINKAEVMIENAHLYSNVVDGKRIELFAKSGEHKDKIILISGVEGSISDINDKSFLKIKTPTGEFNIQDRILRINREVEVTAYRDINRDIKITSKDIEFNIGKRMINFKSELSMENEKFYIVAKSGEYDMNSMSIKLKKLTIKQK
jgi:hypothetical protein